MHLIQDVYNPGVRARSNTKRCEGGASQQAIVFKILEQFLATTNAYRPTRNATHAHNILARARLMQIYNRNANEHVNIASSYGWWRIHPTGKELAIEALDQSLHSPHAELK